MIVSPLLAWLLAAGASPASPQEARRAALAEARSDAAPHLRLRGGDSSRTEAAIEACRERLVRHAEGRPDRDAAAIARALVAASQDAEMPESLARRALHAVAEARDTLGPELADLVELAARRGRESLRADATEVLGEVGGAPQVGSLAWLAASGGEGATASAVAAGAALERVGGKGTTEAFVGAIGDRSLPAASRRALLSAAGRRDLRAASGAALAALAEPELRVEAQKALLRLARKDDLPALRAARTTAEPATRAMLDRLIARLEKA